MHSAADVPSTCHHFVCLCRSAERTLECLRAVCLLRGTSLYIPSVLFGLRKRREHIEAAMHRRRSQNLGCGVLTATSASCRRSFASTILFFLRSLALILMMPASKNEIRPPPSFSLFVLQDYPVLVWEMGGCHLLGILQHSSRPWNPRPSRQTQT